MRTASICAYRVALDAKLAFAVEINENPHRLDLDWRLHRRGLELGCLFSINLHAHTVEGRGLTSGGMVVEQGRHFSGSSPERLEPR